MARIDAFLKLGTQQGCSDVHLAVGVPPYSRGDHMSVMYQHVQGKARTPQDLNPKLPPGMSELVMKSMAVDKTKRFQSMDELRGALERFL